MRKAWLLFNRISEWNLNAEWLGRSHRRASGVSYSLCMWHTSQCKNVERKQCDYPTSSFLHDTDTCNAILYSYYALWVPLDETLWGGTKRSGNSEVTVRKMPTSRNCTGPYGQFPSQHVVILVTITWPLSLTVLVRDTTDKLQCNGVDPSTTQFLQYQNFRRSIV